MATMDALGMYDLNQAAFAQPLTPSARSTGGAVQGKPYKSQLHELFQRVGSGSLNYEVIKSTAHQDPYFDCTLHCPEISSTNNGPCPSTTFTGAGRSKKIAENNASEQALIFYASRGIVQHPHASGQQPGTAHAQIVPTLSPMQPSMIMPEQEHPWSSLQNMHHQVPPFQPQPDQQFHQQMPLVQQQMNQNMHQPILPMQHPHQGLVQVPAQIQQTSQPVCYYASPPQGLTLQAQPLMTANPPLWTAGGTSPCDNREYGKNDIHDLALAVTGGARLSSGYMTKDQALGEIERTHLEQTQLIEEETRWQALVNTEMAPEILHGHFAEAVSKLVKCQKENHLLRREIARRKLAGNEIMEMALCITSNDNESGAHDNGYMGPEAPM